jgi:hypothetical protein
MTSQEMLVLIQKHRDELVTEVDTAADGATLSAFLLLTFAMDMQDGKLTDLVRQYVARVAGEAFDQAREIDFGFKPSSRVKVEFTTMSS